MTSPSTRLGVIWIMARIHHLCEECEEQIQPGDPMAVYDDISVNSWGKHLHTKRHYCEECGHLLEDSLTTTEAME